MDPKKIEARIAEAARSFDAELHTKAYAETHSDSAQLVRLLSFLSPGRDQVILDLGTGNGYVAMAIAGAHPGCRVIGVDIAAQAIDRDVEQAGVQGLANADFQSYDGIRLPFAYDHFDAAICRYAFHHLPQPETTLDELGRTVRSGGRLVLADAIRDDADDVDFVNHFQEMKRDGHVRMHRGTDLINLVSRHGFDLIERFESSIFFTRERTAEYDDLLAMTPERVLQAYSLAVAEREMHLRFRILNALFVNRQGWDVQRPPSPAR
jgi:ubiquinone/menaquinone biosynthesis C-methylase UbiE